MLTKWDDYFVHQIDEPIERVHGSNELWLESCSYVAGSVDDRVHVVTGVVSHPNAGVMAGYAFAKRNSMQYNFWASRELNNDRTNTIVGPLSFIIIEPMSRWSLKLAENKYCPISFDLEFEPVADPYWAKTTPQEAEFGERYCIFFEELRPSGRLTIAGEDFDAEGYWGNRSRFWGMRGDWKNLGLFIAVLATFKDYRIYLYYQESIDGNPRMIHGAIMPEGGNPVPIVEVRSNLSFEPGTRWLPSPKLELVDANGKQHKLSARLSNTGIRFKPSPGRLFHEHYGAFHLEGDTWDLNDHDIVLSNAKWVSHWICEYCCDDDTGHGLLEYAVTKKHQRYGPTI
ncbi:hypothetical protein ACFLVL_02460 [Chloroflexota bacterium]